jgi:hypothetical protein
MPHGTARAVNFGLEIECNIPRSHYSDIPMGRQIPLGPDGWKAKQDGSIAVLDAGFYGAEIVSPKLRGLDGLGEIQHTLNYIRSIGGSVNPSCGMHLHLDARGLDAAEIDRVRAAFVRYEMAFFAVNGDAITRRLRSTYCAPFMRWDRADGRGNRYQSLNLTNLGNSAKRTVELRLFESTLDPERAIVAAYMGVALMVRALHRETPDPIEQIADPRAAVEAFIDAHLNTADPTQSRYWIVPDETTDDIVSKLDTLAIAAASALTG